MKLADPERNMPLLVERAADSFPPNAFLNMKTFLLLFVPVMLVHTALGADELTPVLLQSGKDYSFRFAENARTSVTGPVRVLSAPQDGWVRIEYAPGRPLGVVPRGAATEKPPTKKQVWLNLAYVVTIQDWEAATRDAEQRAAENAERRSAHEAKPVGQ